MFPLKGITVVTLEHASVAQRDLHVASPARRCFRPCLAYDLAGEGRTACLSQAACTTQSHSLDKLEQHVIFDALAQTAGRRDRAAEMLGISTRTLLRKLKVYGEKNGETAVCASETV